MTNGLTEEELSALFRRVVLFGNYRDVADLLCQVYRLTRKYVAHWSSPSPERASLQAQFLTSLVMTEVVEIVEKGQKPFAAIMQICAMNHARTSMGRIGEGSVSPLDRAPAGLSGMKGLTELDLIYLHMRDIDGISLINIVNEFCPPGVSPGELGSRLDVVRRLLDDGDADRGIA